MTDEKQGKRITDDLLFGYTPYSNHEMRDYVLARYQQALDATARLRAENQRLKEEKLDLERELTRNNTRWNTSANCIVEQTKVIEKLLSERQELWDAAKDVNVYYDEYLTGEAVIDHKFNTLADYDRLKALEQLQAESQAMGLYDATQNQKCVTGYKSPVVDAKEGKK